MILSSSLSSSSRPPGSEPTSGSAPKRVALLGGTFDPIHHGHLRTALEIRDLLAVDQLNLIPCYQPVHRGEPHCSAKQRMDMVRLAVADEPGLVADDRELRRNAPSYSVDTLHECRQEWGRNASLTMIMGMDAFLSLHRWHRWEEILGLANLLVVQRPGWALTAEHPIYTWAKDFIRPDPVYLQDTPCGVILLHEQTPLDISSTHIRTLITAGRSARYLLPDPVWNYVCERQLYRTGTEEICKLSN